MSPKQKLMTSGEFAKKAGMTAAKVSKLIRDGKIKATKVSGRWRIDPSQLKALQTSTSGRHSTAGEKKSASRPKSDKNRNAPGKGYTVAEFAAMTYLTEKGVLNWLKTGRLKGRTGPNDEWTVDAANLQVPDISRLVRK